MVYPFDNLDTSQTVAWVDPGTLGHQFDESISIPGEANGWRWRARVLYAPMNLFIPGSNPLTVKADVSLPTNPRHSRWYFPHWATVGPSDFRISGYRPPTDPGVTVTPD